MFLSYLNPENVFNILSNTKKSVDFLKIPVVQGYKITLKKMEDQKISRLRY